MLENLYREFVSDPCAGLIGGLGVAPGANTGDEYGISQAVYGSAPDIAGKNMANPIAIILSSGLMLEYLAELEGAKRIQRAVHNVMASGEKLTCDLGGNGSTTGLIERTIEELKSKKEVG